MEDTLSAQCLSRVTPDAGKILNESGYVTPSVGNMLASRDYDFIDYFGLHQHEVHRFLNDKRLIVTRLGWTSDACLDGGMGWVADVVDVRLDLTRCQHGFDGAVITPLVTVSLSCLRDLPDDDGMRAVMDGLATVVARGKCTGR